ncbi:MAG: NAD(P)/FAD-dependent oxidoreductase [Candidatus Dormibacteria bacterium]
METVDFGVIGGGIHGVSAGFHLAARGARVRLFEAGAPASGPTGRSSAVCRAYYTNPFLAGVAAESLAMFRAFADLTKGRESGFRTTGIMYLHPVDDLESLRSSIQRLDLLGTRVDLLEGKDLADRCVGFDLDGIRVGAWEPEAGYADPVSTTQGMLERAVEVGLERRLYGRITGLSAIAGGGATVTAADGSTTRCRSLLIAAGPWTRGLALQVGVDLPLSVERHVVATFGWSDARRIGFSFADVVRGIYAKPEGSELFIVGSLLPAAGADPDNFNHNITQVEIDEHIELLTRRVPALGAAVSRGGWASLYDVSPDWQPVIGEIEDGIFVDAGTSGHGFKLGPALGRHVADLLSGAPDPELAQFHPRRFASERQLSAGFGATKILG